MKANLNLHYADPFSFSSAKINPRVHTPEQISSLKKSIKKFGFLVPVLVDEKKELIAGHARVMAAQDLNMKEIPFIFITSLTEKEKKAFLLLENRLHEKSSWDWDLFTQEIESIKSDFDLMEIGFDSGDFSPEEKNLEFESENSDSESDSHDGEENPYDLKQFCLIVTLKSESQQKKVFQKLMAEGYEVRFA